MGDWIMVIKGVGPHGNKKKDDAESLMVEAVDQLKARGHAVQDALFMAGQVVTKETVRANLKKHQIIVNSTLVGTDEDSLTGLEIKALAEILPHWILRSLTGGVVDNGDNVVFGADGAIGPFGFIANPREVSGFAAPQEV